VADDEDAVDTAGVHSAVVQALRLRLKRDESLNRYQVAVAAGEPVVMVAPVLEQLVSDGTLTAIGDVDSPNNREYMWQE
jgi:hypothetical protein